MWVRSQDKEVLTNGKFTYTIVINFEDEKSKWDIELINGIDYDKVPLIVATYSKKSKAIKVLDMLEEHINNSNEFYTIYDTEKNTIVTQTKFVFQFPKDEEV